MALEQSSQITFSVAPEKELKLDIVPGVFTPNTTTLLLIQAVRQMVSAPAKLLDLGCGTGVVGLVLHQQGLVLPPIYASDLSLPAVECSRKNLARYGCPAEVRGGSLFEPWRGEKFEVIVDDISGIAQAVAEISPWFPGVPCATGADGLELVTDILRQSPRHLSAGGMLFFPVLSLSNAPRLLQVAYEVFGSMARVGRQSWPLPADLKPHLPLLKELAAAGAIILEERFGMFLCYTEVYCARAPRH